MDVYKIVSEVDPEEGTMEDSIVGWHAILSTPLILEKSLIYLGEKLIDEIIIIIILSGVAERTIELRMYEDFVVTNLLPWLYIRI